LDPERLLHPTEEAKGGRTMTTNTPSGEPGATSQAAAPADSERADLLAALASARRFLRYTTRDLTDEQARQRTTKHVAAVEQSWTRFIVEGPSAMGDASEMTEADYAERASQFSLLPTETLDGVLGDYQQVASRTDELVGTLPDLNAAQPLPRAPWFPPGAQWSARQALLHIVAETAQHAGHADIIRESLDGAKTMG
jgi:uncharacterized damage-inducible protein DinB